MKYKKQSFFSASYINSKNDTLCKTSHYVFFPSQKKNAHFKALCSKDFREKHFFTHTYSIIITVINISWGISQIFHVCFIPFQNFLHKTQLKVLRQLTELRTEVTLLFIPSPPLFILLEVKVGLTTAAPGVCCESLERSLLTISHWSSCSYHNKGV